MLAAVYPTDAAPEPEAEEQAGCSSRAVQLRRRRDQ